MFFKERFKKRREAKAAAHEEAQQAYLMPLRAQLEAAEACTEPAEKFLQLTTFNDDLNHLTARMNQEKADSAEGSALLVLGTLFGGSFAGMAIVCAISPWLIPIPIAASIWGCKKIAEAGSDEAYDAKNKTFIEGIAALKTGAQDSAAQLLKDRLTEIAASPKFADVMAKAPAMKEEFAKAVAGRMAQLEAPQSKTQPGQGFHL
jgi:hypothetical protein